MCIVAPLERLASASCVFFGPHGAVTLNAQQRGLSRQCLYRQAHSALRDLDATPHQQQLALLQDQLCQLQAHLKTLQYAQSLCVQITPDLQAHFAATAQAEGVSLPVARRLLAVLLPEKCPSV